jgi:riboflavin kinase/FMN adenylyltransferase
MQGACYHGVINLGVRPTVARGQPQRTLEIHLLDFDRDIYGQDMEVRFRQYLRPEMKFENVEALKAQITADVSQARALSER